MQKELFKQQCDLDIQKAMVKHFIKEEKAKQLILTDVVSCFTCKFNNNDGKKEPICYHCSGNLDMHEPK